MIYVPLGGAHKRHSAGGGEKQHDKAGCEPKNGSGKDSLFIKFSRCGLVLGRGSVESNMTGATLSIFSIFGSMLDGAEGY